MVVTKQWLAATSNPQVTFHANYANAVLFGLFDAQVHAELSDSRTEQRTAVHPCGTRVLLQDLRLTIVTACFQPEVVQVELDSIQTVTQVVSGLRNIAG